jgi:hypothetical protein
MLDLYGEEFIPPPSSQPGGILHVCCPRLLIQYNVIYCTHLEADSSISKLRTQYAVVARDTLNTDPAPGF